MSEESSGGGESSSAPAEASSAESSQANISTGGANAQGGENGSPEAQIAEALESGDKKEAQRLMKKFDLKVKGQTISREYDLSDENFLKNQFQLAEVAKQEMQSSAELKRAYQKEMERFKAKPWEVLKELGFDPDELAQSRIEQRIEEMKKSPEQIEQEQLREELKQAREEAKRVKEEKEALEMQKFQEQAKIQITDEISKAITTHGRLPNSPYVQKKVAAQLVWAMDNGFEDATADDVIDAVEHEMKLEMGQLYDEMPEELLEQFIGKKNIERMRKKRVAAAKVPSVNDIKPTTLSTKANEAQSKKPAQPISSRDFFKKLGR